MSLSTSPRASTPDPKSGSQRARAASIVPDVVVAERYRLVRQLGAGAMGEVWLAVHQALGTEVAIKFLRLEDEQELTEMAERFAFEARVSARLCARSRHVVAVHDAGRHDSIPYLAMEFVPGETLEDRIARERLAPEVVAEILAQAADALHAAHELGIVHRDLKPSNIMLSKGSDGRVLAKVADFGIAKAFRADVPLESPKATGEGVFVGSPSYMSPEQLRADGQVDPRSDAWALGVVAYEALTGKLPFDGRSVVHVMVAITDHEPAPPSSLRPELPDAIDAWMKRALAKDPQKRFSTLAEMVEAFDAAVGEGTAPPARRTPWIVAGAVALIAIAVASIIALRSPQRPEPRADGLVSSAIAPAPPAPVPAPPPSSDVVAPEPTASAAPPERRAAVPPRSAPSKPVATSAPTAAKSAAPASPAPRRKEIDPSEIQ